MLPSTQDGLIRLSAAERFWNIYELRHLVYANMPENVWECLNEYPGLILASPFSKDEVTKQLIKKYNDLVVYEVSKYKTAHDHSLIKITEPTTLVDLRKANVLLPVSMFLRQPYFAYIIDKTHGRFGNCIASNSMPMWSVNVKSIVFSIYDDIVDCEAVEEGYEFKADYYKMVGISEFVTLINEALKTLSELKATHVAFEWGLHLADHRG